MIFDKELEKERATNWVTFQVLSREERKISDLFVSCVGAFGFSCYIYLYLHTYFPDLGEKLPIFFIFVLKLL